MQRARIEQFLIFCLIGSSGVIVDMTVLHFLADKRWLGWNLVLSKICSAETAMLSNFIWNEVWTFREFTKGDRNSISIVRRLVKFNAICAVGIGFAVVALQCFHVLLHLDLYLSNLLAILLVTIWNFGMNVLFNWRTTAKEAVASGSDPSTAEPESTQHPNPSCDTSGLPR